MPQPTKPTVPDAPLRSQPATFSARLENSLVFWPTFATYLDEVGTYTEEQAAAALAAATAGDLPSITGQALNFIRVNTGGTAVEFITPAQVLAAIGAVTDSDLTSGLALKAPLASPPLTGNPTATTQTAGNDSTRIATTAYTRLAIPNVLNASGAAPVFACRAWVSFIGLGTVTIRGSGNVSSITDNGTGQYTVNFTTAMSDTNYSVSATSGGISTNTALTGVAFVENGSLAVGSVGVNNKNTNNAYSDVDMFVAIHR